MMQTVKEFGIVNKVEGDVFLELSCFFDAESCRAKGTHFLFTSQQGGLLSAAT